MSEIACSPESTLFAASDVDGNVKIYNYHLDTCGKCILSFRLCRSLSQVCTMEDDDLGFV